MSHHFKVNDLFILSCIGKHFVKSVLIRAQCLSLSLCVVTAALVLLGNLTEVPQPVKWRFSFAVTLTDLTNGGLSLCSGVSAPIYGELWGWK